MKQEMEIKMNRKALIVIDVQNDITKQRKQRNLLMSEWNIDYKKNMADKTEFVRSSIIDKPAVTSKEA